MKMERQKRKCCKEKTLSKQIILIVLIPIMVGFIMAGAGYMMLHKYHDQVSEREDIISEIYLEQMNRNFGQINISVRSMLYSGDKIEEMVEAYRVHQNYLSDQEKMSLIIRQNNAVKEVKDAFSELCATYGKHFNFFYFDRESGEKVESGGCSYNIRQKFVNKLWEMLENDSLPYTSGGKWFLIDDCICTIYKGPNGVSGAWIWAKDFAEDLCKLSPQECYGGAIYDEQTGKTLVYKKQENGILKLTEEEGGGTYKKISHAAFSGRFIMDTSEYEKTIRYPMLFLMLTLLYFVIASGVLIYSRKSIIQQAEVFVRNLKESDGNFENVGIAEFAEAGRALNRKSDEIRQLQIDIYKEQLKRQEVEMDYMQLQIRPHFYINCLNIIHSMAQEGLTKEIQKFTVYISTYLRYIFKKGMEPVTVESEIAFTQNYLNILSCMNDRTYGYKIYCEQELEKVLIPPLMIQTFVENSVKYNLDLEENLFIEVSVKKAKEGEKMEICISDNGCGIEEPTRERYNAGIFETADSTQHIGIRNTVARLRMMYQEKAKIRFAQNEGGGAFVKIELPLQAKEENRDEHIIGG